MGAAWGETLDLTGEGEPERLPAALVTEDLLPMLGARARLGRLFTGSDFDGQPQVAILSAGVWRRRFGGSEAVVGRPLRLDGRQVVVVGVLDAGFVPPSALVGERVDVWMPLDVEAATIELRGQEWDLREHGLHVLSVVGRLARDVTLATAQGEIDALRARQARDTPRHYTDREGEVDPVPLVTLHEATVGGVSDTLYLLLGAVGMMLLISCANVANLSLAQGAVRARELAVRCALGASRGRLVLQLLTESVLLAVASGIAGTGLAWVGVRLLARFDPGGIPRLAGAQVDPRILAFALVLSAATGVLFGVLPAFHASGGRAGETLKEGAANVTSSRTARRARGALVVAELAIALILLAGAGLMFRSLLARVGVDPGFDTDRVVTVGLELGSGYDPAGRTRFAAELVERLGGLAGSEAAAAGWTLPFVVTGGGRCCWRTDVMSLDRPDDALPTTVHPVTPGYFETLHTPILAGRGLLAADADATPAAVLNGPAARELLGDEDPLGRVVRLGDDRLTVVGVVEGVRHWGLDQEVEPAAYVPYSRYGGMLPLLRVAVRSEVGVAALAPRIREVVGALDPDLPVDEILTMRQRISASLASPRFLALLFGAFAGAALLLACGGVYSSMLYLVGQRRRELGIRLALGAGAADVVGLVLRHAVGITVVGLGLGVAGALALSRLLESLVWGVETGDALTFSVVTLLLAVAALAPCAWVARRAARTDPLEVLGAE